MAIKYAVPQFLESTELERDEYVRWLHRKARSHSRRDGKRWQKKIFPSKYKRAIHEAVLRSGGEDFYTHERLEWSLIGKYNNDEAEKKGVEYRKDLALLPTVDHEDPGAQEPVFRICGMQTNDCKSNLTVEELKEFCKKFLKAQGDECAYGGSS